jgi:hypothetical protein
MEYRMKLTEQQLNYIFEFQRSKPLVASEDVLEDIKFMLHYSKSKMLISADDEIFKYFIEKNGNYTLYYANGFNNLKDKVGVISRKCYKVRTNGGIPIFVEG